MVWNGTKHRGVSIIGVLAMVVSLLAAPPSPLASAPAGAVDPLPIGHWTFDEASAGTGTGTVVDSSVGGNDGTINGGALYVPGVVGTGALSFDGTNDYVDIGLIPDLDLTGGSYTIAFWVKQGAAQLGRIVNMDDGANTSGGYSVFASTNMRVTHNNGAANDFNVPSPFGVWSHTAATYDSAAQTLTLWIDGVDSGSISVPGGDLTTDGDDPLWFGGIPCCVEQLFEGSIDDIRLYDVALSAGEIANLIAARSLQSLIDEADPGDTINVPAGTYNEDLTIDKDLTIEGAGVVPGDVTIDGTGSGSVVTVEAGAVVTLRNLTITGGVAPAGGGIYNSGDLTLDSVVVDGNLAETTGFPVAVGGGIYNDGISGGTLEVINNSVLSGNEAGSFGVGSVVTSWIPAFAASGYSCPGGGSYYQSFVAETSVLSRVDLVYLTVPPGTGLATVTIREGSPTGSIVATSLPNDPAVNIAQFEWRAGFDFANPVYLDFSSTYVLDFPCNQGNPKNSDGYPDGQAFGTSGLPFGDGGDWGFQIYDDDSRPGDGGAVYNDEGTVTIDGSAVAQNRARAAFNGETFEGGRGGGIYNTGTDQNNGGFGHIEIMASSEIVGNTADGHGGGIYSIIPDSGCEIACTTIVTDSVVSGNITNGNGGGIFSSSDQVSLTDSKVFANSAGGDGGGIYYEDFTEVGPDITILDSQVGEGTIPILEEGNTAGGSGGGIYIFASSSVVPPDVTVRGSTVDGNTATNGDGGGIYFYSDGSSSSGTLTVDQASTVSGNAAADDGGGIYADSPVIVEDSTISANTAQTGGGIYSFDDLTVTQSTVEQNEAGPFSSGSGGGILSAGGNVLIDRSTISGNATADSGGGIELLAGVIDITNSTISSNTADEFGSGYGGGLSLSATGASTINNTTIFNNSGNYGVGGITANAQVTVSNSIIAGNIGATGGGGGGPEDCSGSVVSGGSNILGNLQAADCAGIGTQPGDQTFVFDPGVEFDLLFNGGSTRTHALLATSPAVDAGAASTVCEPSDQRGVVRADYAPCDIGAFELEVIAPPTLQELIDDNTSGTLVVPEGTYNESVVIDKDITIIGDGAGFTVDADSGAAITINPTITGSTVVIENATITGGTDSGIVINDGPVIIRDSEVSGNDAGSNPGGGIRNATTDKLTLDNTQVLNNTTTGSGGGVYSVGGDVELFNNTVVGSNEAGIGGGVYIAAANLVIEDSVVGGSGGGNTASAAAGGIYLVSGSVGTFENAEVTLNDAQFSGGGIFVDGSDLSLLGVDVLDNESALNGGGIFAANNATVSVNASSVDDNVARNGGGIFLQNPSSTGVVLEVANNSTVTGNLANDGGFGAGGGIYFNANGATLSLINSSVNSNDALDDPVSPTTGGSGGGIFLANGTLEADGADISNNRAWFSGGGVYIDSASMTSSGAVTTVDGNQAGLGLSGDELGGGIFLAAFNGARVTLDPGQVTNNTINDGSGGGIAALGFEGISTVELYDGLATGLSLVSGNTAFRGGGIYLDTDTLVSEGTAFLNNVAQDDGGAIYAFSEEDEAFIDLSDAVISGNIAGGRGGGIAALANTETLIFESSITGNASGSTDTLGFSGQNGDGGGIYSAGIALELEEVTVADNDARGGAGGGLSAADPTSILGSTISGNRALTGTGGTGNGGGIDAVGSTNISDSTISANSADNFGGGIYALGGGSVDARNVTISGNDAAVFGGAVYANTTGVIAVNNVTVTGNSTPTNTGGIDIFSGTLDISNTILSGNLPVASNIADCRVSGGATLNSGGYNLVGTTSQCADFTGPGDITGVTDPQVEPLGLNFPGVTETHAITTGGPAVDAGDPGSGCEVFDQRGIARDDYAPCDIGAYELEEVAPTLQELIDATPAGNQLIVPEGTYNERINITKDITITGAGAGFTIAAPPSEGLPAVTIFEVTAGDITGVLIENATITGGTDSGIVLNHGPDGPVIVRDATITGNSGFFNGGGIINNSGGKLTLDNTVVELNSSDETDGGGVWSTGDVDVINGAAVRNNTAGRGAGIFMAGGDLLVDGSDIGGVGVGNTATGNGGGVYLSTGSDLYATNGATVTANAVGSGSFGGGVYAGATTTVTLDGNATGLFDNQAPGGIGGGIFSLGNVDVIGAAVNSNDAEAGGGVALEGGTLNLSPGSQVSVNTATLNGGGIYVYQGGSVVHTGGDVLSNVAQLGGGIYAIENSTVTVDGASAVATVDDNIAQRGGGIYVSATIAGTFLEILDGAQVRGNEAQGPAASGGGGGIFFTGVSGSRLVVDGGEVSFNTALDVNTGTPTDGGSGGGIYLDGPIGASGPVLDAIGAAFDGNRAFVDGGGIYSSYGTVNVTALSVVTNNEAETGGGGGIFGRNEECNFSPCTINVVDSTVSNNDAPFGNGGGIYADEDLVLLTDSSVTGNEAVFGGGVYIDSQSALETLRATIADNVASASGGGIFTEGFTQVNDSTVDGNNADASGGGIWSDSTLLFSRSTLSNNSAIDGGGLFTDHNTGELVEFVNSTISGNNATTGTGGAISTAFEITLNNATVTDNNSSFAGGIASVDQGLPSPVSNSIIAGNAGNDCEISVLSGGYNLVGTGCAFSGDGDISGVTDPVLGPLQDNGGPTFTHEVLPGSPAANAGDPGDPIEFIDSTCEDTDQRGILRADFAPCDIGAFESDIVAIPPDLDNFVFDVNETDADGTVLSSPKNVQVGVGEVPISLIPIEAIVGESGGADYEASPLGAIPLGAIPLGAIDLNASPLGAIPLGAIDLDAIDLPGNALAQIPLSSIPLQDGRNWETILAGTGLEGIPLQNVTLDQVPSNLLDDIDLGDVGLEGSPLASLSLPSLGLGDADLLSIDPTLCDGLPDPGICSNGDTNTVLELEIASAPLGAIPLGAIPLVAIPLGAIPLGAIPLGAIPLGVIPLGAIPLGAIAPAEAPLGAIDLLGSPLGAIPLGAIPLGAIPLGAIPLGAIPLGAIPLGAIGDSWACDALEGDPSYDCDDLGIVPGDDTLAELVAAIEAAGGDVASTPLGAIVLSDVPLGAIPLGAIPLGAIPLGAIGLNAATLAQSPLGAIPLGAINVDGVVGCDLLVGSVYDCGSLPTINDDSSLAEYLGAVEGIAGDDLTATPLGAIPLGAIEFGAIPLGAIELDTVTINDAPLGAIPLGAIGLGDTGLASSPLGAILLADLTETSQLAVVDCGAVNCFTGTLGDAELAEAILGGATLGDLSTLGATTLQDLDDLLTMDLLYPDGSLGDGLDFGSLTLGQILISLLLDSNYPWETLALDELGLQGIAPNSFVTYSATFDLTGSGPALPGTVLAQMPRDFFYVEGSAIVLSDGGSVETPLAAPSIEELPNGRVELTFALELDAGDTYTVQWLAVPGFDIGTFVTGASVAFEAVPEPSGTTADNAPALTVVEKFTANNAFASPAGIEEDVLVFSHIAAAGQTDYFSFEPGVIGTSHAVFLSQFADDTDLVLYQPAVDPVSEVAPRTIPLGAIPIEDDGADRGGNATEEPELEPDLPIAAAPLGAISINRGDTPEEAESTLLSSPLNSSEPYTIQVSGYQGNASSSPYVLRVDKQAAVEIPSCSSAFFTGLNSSLPASVPVYSIGGGAGSALPADLNTIFLVNYDRLVEAAPVIDGSGPTADDVINAINALIADGANGVVGAVIAVEEYNGIATAYGAWDTNPCDPNLANDVVGGISGLVRDIQAERPTLTYVTVVGADDIVPFARLRDLTSIANEATYVDQFSDGALYGSQITGHYLSDDVYGDLDPIPWLERFLHVPELGVGRLVESPSDMIVALDNFVTFAGELDPQTAAVAGYDFLEDGTAVVDERLENIYGAANVESLIDTVGTAGTDAWTRADLLALLDLVDATPGSDTADIITVNAHSDHFRQLPSFGDATNNESDLFEVADLGPLPFQALAGDIVFTMGCHAGLSVSDIGVTTAVPTDWAQTYSGQGAVYLANSGYGYGDTTSVALSERLMAEFAENLDGSLPVGLAMAFAKQEYFAQLGQYPVYDEKAMQQVIFYGLPMYGIGATPPATPPAPLPTAVDPNTGLEAASIGVTPTYETNTSQDGTYFSVDGLAQTTHYRPIQPLDVLNVTPVGDMIAHGAIVTSATTTDQTVDPVFFVPNITGSFDSEPEVDTDEIATPVFGTTIATFNAPGEGPNGEPFVQQQNLVGTLGSFVDGTDGDTIGNQTLVQSANYLVFYADPSSDDFTPPQILGVEAVKAGNQVSFEVEATDNVEVAGVFALYRKSIDSGVSMWVSVPLTQVAPGTYSGGGSVDASITTGFVDYKIYVVDTSGNDATTDFKNTLYEAVPPAPPQPGEELSLSVPAPQADPWYSGPVTVTVTGDPDVTYSYVIPGGSGSVSGNGGTFQVSTNGINPVSVFGEGDMASLTLFIDTTPPGAPIISTPAAGQEIEAGSTVAFAFTCPDVGTGTAVCEGRVNGGAPVTSGSLIDTSQPGSFTLTVQGTDIFNRPSPVSQVAYEVVVSPQNACAFYTANPGAAVGFNVVTGTNGNNRLFGTSGADLILGLGGNDRLYGFGGGDILCGGDGNDRLYGGTGPDILDGADGTDRLYASTGDDFLFGGPGVDYLYGSSGEDLLDGGDGNDWMYGQGNKDEMFGGPGNDALWGAWGDDLLDGGDGDDFLNGQNGHDVLTGGLGRDDLFGGFGRDTLSGGDGNDYLDGQWNDDVLNGGFGDDRLHGRSGKDTLNGGPGADVLDGYNDDDILDGGDGNDIVRGWSGNDTVNGGKGNDFMTGGWGNDVLNGGSGNDDLRGQVGNDTLNGGTGNDSLNGGSGFDIGDGGSGTDSCSSIENETNCE